MGESQFDRNIRLNKNLPVETQLERAYLLIGQLWDKVRRQDAFLEQLGLNSVDDSEEDIINSKEMLDRINSTVEDGHMYAAMMGES